MTYFYTYLGCTPYKKRKQEPKVIKQRTFRSEDQQTKEMERRIQDLEEENAILKKAMHFFAKDHR
ncbi:transposase [Bacillus thuringiensis]|uniref:Uncharacterized protein n=1 Tax=Bacillus thuringiensis Bt18247 TaxID=1423143 RepID=A0A9W3SZI0_BACTU|nr:transposase [Bacillus thuringiensis]AOM14366.1 hypothetical protein BTI247_60360 [Bacillus thuringiensis Bt18247]AOM14456.1 hypothetical protein BTI247_61260 [Bacillus thuringiensis Bt18247]MBG9524821.1 transposase [Bacillus thuringiensis]